MQPLFTIVTVTYNSASWVKYAIESVLASSYQDFEYIICDDCSTDDTWEIIQSYNDPRIKACRNQGNVGEYPNRNKALNSANGTYILYLDGDDILYKDALLEYSRFISYFPEAAGIWGVFTMFFDFIVFPFLFSPEVLTKLNYLSLYPITVVGFTDSVFRVKELQQMGGFRNEFGIGDTFVKRRFACQFPVLLVPAGRAFWRETSNQASNRVRKNYRSFIESMKIDKEILYAEYFPLKGKIFDQVELNFKIRSMKLLIKNTLFKFKFVDFFRLKKILDIPFSNIKYILKKGDYSFKADASGSNPLMNDYHFVPLPEQKNQQ